MNKPKGLLTALAATAAVGLAALTTPALASDVQPNIIGGHDASQPYPGMAALVQDLPGGHFAFCGAYLVSHRYAATNAHCVTTPPDQTGHFSTVDAATLHLRIGSPSRTSGGVVVGVEKVLPHADWQWGMIPEKPIADVALLRLDQYVQLQPFEVAPLVRNRAGVRLIGWGVTEPSGEGPLPNDLQELDTHLLPPSRCAAGGITAGELCVANPNGTDGPCAGDSGGPGLQRIPGTKRWAVLGSTSRGTAMFCGTSPAIYTDTTYYRWWMFTVMRTGQVPPATTAGTTALPQLARKLGWTSVNCLHTADHTAGTGCPNQRI